MRRAIWRIVHEAIARIGQQRGVVAAPSGPLLAVAAALLVAGLTIAAVKMGRLAQHARTGDPEGANRAPTTRGQSVHQSDSYRKLDR